MQQPIHPTQQLCNHLLYSDLGIASSTNTDLKVDEHQSFIDKQSNDHAHDQDQDQDQDQTIKKGDDPVPTLALALNTAARKNLLASKGR